jgi:Phage integrase, N-terminal SAM-like domain
MSTAAPSTALATIQPAFTDPERLALAGYLAGYRGLTREACALDLRQFTGWCRSHSLSLFSVRRADSESFARQLEANGRGRTTVTRRLSTIAGFYRYAVEEELLDHSPAARWRRALPGPSTWPSAGAPTGRRSWPQTDGGQTGTAPGGSSARSPAAPGSPKPSPRTRFGAQLLPPRLMPECRCATSRRPPPMRIREPR